MKIKNVQALRALAANAVVLTHLATVEQKYGGGFHLLPASTHAGACGVDLFFVISGFIMATVAVDMRWSRFLYDRAVRIFPPYWFYTTLVLIVFLLFPAAVNSSYAQPPSLGRSYLLWPDNVGPLLAVGWTLIHEMYFYLCFAAILFLTAATKMGVRTGLLCWAALIVLGNRVSGALGLSDPVLAVVTHPLTLEFMGGVVVGLFLRRKRSAFAFPAFALGLIALVCVFAFLPEGAALVDDLGWRRVALIGPPCVLIVYGAVAMELRPKLIAPDWAVALGDASYSIYLCHVLVLSALGRVFAAILKTPNVWAESLLAIGGLAAANLAGLISFRLLEKPVQKILRRWRPIAEKAVEA